MRPCQLVIPCYNERRRLSSDQIAALVADERVGVILVDDGSSDGTSELLQALAERHPGAVTALIHRANQGKAEAVRSGLLSAVDGGAHLVGFADADFATPSLEILRLLNAIEREQVDVLIGSRVARLGADIGRAPSRHLLGRVFATFASIILQEPVYDTQCGAKWFRVTDALQRTLSEPFTSTWSFDVEFLGRLLGCFDPDPALGPQVSILEYPVRAWHDVPGSKLRLRGMVRASTELVGLMARSHKLHRALKQRWQWAATPGTHPPQA